jgi:hypothetical protein
MIKVARLSFDLKAHVLGFYDVDRLRSAQIRMLPPPPHDAFGEDILGRFDVLGRGYLKNWMIGVDSAKCLKLRITQVNCIKT